LYYRFIIAGQRDKKLGLLLKLIKNRIEQVCPDEWKQAQGPSCKTPEIGFTEPHITAKDAIAEETERLKKENPN
jgi:hypothetical protein